MLPRHERLRRRKDFLACYNEGKAYAQAHVVMYVRPRACGRRFGFVVGKKVGKAVMRNRVKRQLRAVCRACLLSLTDGFDAVFIARKNVVEVDYHQLRREVEILFRNARLWEPSGEQ